jgi:monoamine oxidase
MLVVSGYQRMAEYLSKTKGVTVLLNHKVVSVQNDQGISTVKCSNGFAASAESIIIAVPLGVLKKNAIKFTPALPNWKTEAIKNIGFGNVVKILIVPKTPLNITQQ